MPQDRQPSLASPGKQRLPAWKLWLFRLIALAGLPVLLVVLLELGLRAAGYGHSTGFMLPDAQPGFFRTNQHYVSLFMPESFDLRPLNFRVARDKPANTVRIVVLGESAAQGIPAPPFGFVPQLRAMLRDRYPGRQIEVLNTGIVAINSHVVYQIARDMADFSPDLFVVYLGNNEVVGPYAPGCTYLPGTPPLWAIRASVAIRSTRSGQLLAAVLARFSRRTQPSEWDGMSMFAEQAVAGDDPRLEQVYENFERNLHDIVRVADSAGAKTLVCTVVGNLKDCPPLLSVHSPGLPSGKQASWEASFERGKIAWLLDDPITARKFLEEARRIDPHYADTLYMLGDIELKAANEGAARELLVEAMHWDALRFRPDPRINEIVRRVSETRASVRLLDTAMLLGSDVSSTSPPAGSEILFEHVHFNWDGNHRVARAIAEGIESILGLAQPGAPSWLDSERCAAAIGYTPHERATVLQKLAPLITNPPFTNQLTYPEDMVRFNRSLAQTQSVARDPATLRRARDSISAAVAKDPDNANLAKIEEDVADELGDLPAALAAAQRSRSLQPDNYAVAGDVAIKLLRLGRDREAEDLLRAAAGNATARELVALAPVFGELFSQTDRTAENRRFLDELVSFNPGDANLRLLRARTFRKQKEYAAAERDLREILRMDPGHPGGLEALVSLMMETGRTAEAEQLTLDSAARQPRNHANNARAAAISQARGDEDSHLRFLLASERSGEITSAVELRIARLLIARNRELEGLEHLAHARRISVIEGDAATTKGIDELLRQLGPAAQLH